MPNFKPEASFFRKIVVGAIGIRSVCRDMNARGHEMRELERGSSDTKLWKEVKRKRVRIPDLVCQKCGLRVEGRTKTRSASKKPELAMSHSESEAERAWDFGMIDADIIAFPVCVAEEDRDWARGRLAEPYSYWRQRNWIKWCHVGAINYFTVASFRAVAPDAKARKGAEEGSETTLIWAARWAACSGKVIDVTAGAIRVRPDRAGSNRSWRVPAGHAVHVKEGDSFAENQIIASRIVPMQATHLTCPGKLPADCIERSLSSRERTVRFAGVKLARLRNDASYEKRVRELASDAEEDMYVRFEGLAYLCAVCKASVFDLFSPQIASADPQIQLESVISIGEIANDEATRVLDSLLHDQQKPYFIRSAAAWCLGKIGTARAQDILIHAFADVNVALREEALEAIVSLGQEASPVLLGRIDDTPDIAAGCAEALRQAKALPAEAWPAIEKALTSGAPSNWLVWLIGHLQSPEALALISKIKARKPELHYAVSLLWSFTNSWISRSWELQPYPASPPAEVAHVPADSTGGEGISDSEGAAN